jgi:ABC-2 type transport system permease protein
VNSAAQSPALRKNGSGIFIQAFAGLFLRDLRVLSRELVPFVLRVVMQPLLFLFVFTYVFPHMNTSNPISEGAGPNFATILLPGLMAVAIMFSGIAGVALPLASEFGVTREIDDRVMCPLPVTAVAVEKVCFSALQSILAALLIIPLALLVPSTPVHVHVSNWPLLLAVLVLASLTSGALGLTIGSTVKPQQIGLVFSIVVIPITFLGCVYYPWAFLSHVRWLQVAVLVNPIVYMSEGLRAALTPAVPHMSSPLILVALLLSLALLWWVGLKGFLRRVIS